MENVFLNKNPLNVVMLNTAYLNGGYKKKLSDVDENGYIRFKDPEVSRILAENFGDGIGTTHADVSKVTSLNHIFRFNTIIENFDEFKLFTNVTQFSDGDDTKGTFEGCSNLKSIKFPESIKLFFSNTFKDCTSLAIDLDIPTCEFLKSGCFQNSGIKSIVNLGKVSSIGPTVFQNCAGLTTVNLPSTLEEIEYAAFGRCKNLQFDVANLPKSIKYLSYAFDSAIKVYGEISLPNLENIGSNSFGNTSVTKALDLGKISSLGAFSFDEFNISTPCLTYVKLPIETLRLIGDSCFRRCSALIEVEGLDKDNNIETIEVASFRYCSSLPMAINLPKIKNIGAYAFEGCSNIKQVHIGKDISSMGTKVFDGCSSIPYFIVDAIIPANIDASTFDGTNNAVIYVPDASVEAYKTATGWIEYASRIKPLSEYPGFIIVDGVELDAFNRIKLNDTMSIVGFVDCQPDTDILWGVGNGGQNGILCEYDIDMKYIDYWGVHGNPRKIHIKNNTFKIRASFTTEHLDYAYIYDETNDVYLWKGKYVE